MKKLLFLILLVAIFVVYRQQYLFGRSYTSRLDCEQEQPKLEQQESSVPELVVSPEEGLVESGCRKKRRRKRRRKTPAQTSPYGKVDYHSPAESVFGDQGTRGMASPSLDVSGMSESGTFGR